MDRTELEIQAEQVYPMPLNACAWTRKKVFWLREQWVKEKATNNEVSS